MDCLVWNVARDLSEAFERSLSGTGVAGVQDEVLNRLNSQIDELTDLLALERGDRQDLEDNLANLQSSLSETESERSRLQQMLESGAGASAAVAECSGATAKLLCEH